MFGRMQFAIDATLVSPVHCDGTASPGAAHIDGVALQVGRRRKERICLELVGPRTRSRLVVLAGEVGVCAVLGKSEGSEPSVLRNRVERAWRLWWVALLACADVLLPALCQVFEDVAR